MSTLRRISLSQAVLYNNLPGFNGLKENTVYRIENPIRAITFAGYEHDWANLAGWADQHIMDCNRKLAWNFIQSLRKNNIDSDFFLLSYCNKMNFLIPYSSVNQYDRIYRSMVTRSNRLFDHYYFNRNHDGKISIYLFDGQISSVASRIDRGVCIESLDLEGLREFIELASDPTTFVVKGLLSEEETLEQGKKVNYVARPLDSTNKEFLLTYKSITRKRKK